MTTALDAATLARREARRQDLLRAALDSAISNEYATQLLQQARELT